MSEATETKVMGKITQVMAHRLASAHHRLLDLYGGGRP